MLPSPSVHFDYIISAMCIVRVCAWCSRVSARSLRKSAALTGYFPLHQLNIYSTVYLWLCPSACLMVDLAHQTVPHLFLEQILFQSTLMSWPIKHIGSSLGKNGVFLHAILTNQEQQLQQLQQQNQHLQTQLTTIQNGVVNTASVAAAATAQNLVIPTAVTGMMLTQSIKTAKPNKFNGN